MKFVITAWRSGRVNHLTGAGFGLRIPKNIRRDFFSKEWQFIYIRTHSETFKVNITLGFWNECNEVRSPKIGLWLIDNNLNSWSNGRPPKISLEYLGNQTFYLSEV
ncbi:MAG: hypothetical protein ACTH4U_10610 [Pseudoalteromonas prydzensis]|uniref:hypothetical protein n=1 Tax=Pseudoalteromonas prydzensis TaxID=182141 RepID=UPI003F981F37